MNPERYLLFIGAGQSTDLLAGAEARLAPTDFQRHDIGAEITLFASPSLPVLRHDRCVVLGQIQGTSPTLLSNLTKGQTMDTKHILEQVRDGAVSVEFP